MTAALQVHWLFFKWSWIGLGRVVRGRLFVFRDAPLAAVVMFAEMKSPQTEGGKRLNREAVDELKLRLRSMRSLIERMGKSDNWTPDEIQQILQPATKQATQ